MYQKLKITYLLLSDVTPKNLRRTHLIL